MTELDLQKINELLHSKEVQIANLCKATRADGSKFFVYILQTYKQMDAMNKVMEIGASLDFSQFGDVLAYGEGHEPPEEMQKEIEAKHSLDHNFEENLAREFKELQQEFERMKKLGVSEQEFLTRKLKAVLAEMKKEENS